MRQPSMKTNSLSQVRTAVCSLALTFLVGSGATFAQDQPSAPPPADAQQQTAPANPPANDGQWRRADDAQAAPSAQTPAPPDAAPPADSGPRPTMDPNYSQGPPPAPYPNRQYPNAGQYPQQYPNAGPYPNQYPNAGQYPNQYP